MQSIPPLAGIVHELRQCLARVLAVQQHADAGETIGHGARLSITARRLHRAARTLADIGKLALELEALNYQLSFNLEHKEPEKKCHPL